MGLVGWALVCLGGAAVLILLGGMQTESGGHVSPGATFLRILSSAVGTLGLGLLTLYAFQHPIWREASLFDIPLDLAVIGLVVTCLSGLGLLMQLAARARGR